MRAVIQRVSNASVAFDNKEKETQTIGKGLLIFLGIEEDDGTDDIEWLCGKIVRLRIFEDDENKMNCSVNDIGGEILLISQFTLHATTKKGNRPSFIKAAKPEIAIPIYNTFINQLSASNSGKVKTGAFGASMQVELTNNGPVTIIIDTKNKE
jgi:D-tyrosyl-tRNA(Tyr) deacylase